MDCMCATDQVCFHDLEAIEQERDALVEALQEIADLGCAVLWSQEGDRRCETGGVPSDEWCPPCVALAALKKREQE